MPKLTDEERESIKERQATRERISASFKNRMYLTLHCRFCNWASNGLTYDEASEANDEHVRAHPEYQEWTDAALSHEEAQRWFHDHDCISGTCACKCGCRTEIGCKRVAGPICAACWIPCFEGNSEHGMSESL